MKLEHVAIWTRDLEAMRSFFETYFGAVAGNRYDNPSTGFSSYFLSFDSGSRLEIMTRSDLAGRPNVDMAVGLAHIAIALGSREAVDSLTSRLERTATLWPACHVRQGTATTRASSWTVRATGSS